MTCPHCHHDIPDAAVARHLASRGGSRNTPAQQAARKSSTGRPRLPEATDERIQALRVEAGAAGDAEMVATCDRALAGSARARRRCQQVLAEAAAAV